MLSGLHQPAKLWANAHVSRRFSRLRVMGFAQRTQSLAKTQRRLRGLCESWRSLRETLREAGNDGECRWEYMDKATNHRQGLRNPTLGNRGSLTNTCRRRCFVRRMQVELQGL